MSLSLEHFSSFPINRKAGRFIASQLNINHFRAMSRSSLTSIIFLSILIAIDAKSFEKNLDDRLRIIGGITAPDGAAPYQVSLQTIFGHNCGGAIIGRRWIATAAHCIQGYTPSAYKVVAGTNDLKKGGTSYAPDLLIYHKRYNQPAFHNDIGLIRLKEPIEYTEKVQPIVYWEHEVPANATITLTGWGRLSVSF